MPLVGVVTTVAPTTFPVVFHVFDKQAHPLFRVLLLYALMLRTAVPHKRAPQGAYPGASSRAWRACAGEKGVAI